MADKMMGTCIEQFGDPFVFIPEGTKKRISGNGIFNAAQVIVDNSGEAPVETTAPVLCIRLSDFTDKGIKLPQQDDRFIINSKIYRVNQNPQDGLTESRLILFCEGEANA